MYMDILKLMLEKYEGVWKRFIWAGIETSDGKILSG
jgi:hypothetical protein